MSIVLRWCVPDSSWVRTADELHAERTRYLIDLVEMQYARILELRDRAAAAADRVESIAARRGWT